MGFSSFEHFGFVNRGVRVSQLKTFLAFSILLSSTNVIAAGGAAYSGTKKAKTAAEKPVLEEDPAKQQQAAPFVDDDHGTAEEPKKEEEEEDKSGFMSQIGAALSALMGGTGSGSKGTGSGATSPGSYSNKPPSDCSKAKEPDPKMLADYLKCKGGKSGAVQAHNGLVMNSDEKVGYQVDSSGKVLNCFTITVGSGGVGLGGNPPGDNQTEVGFFYSQVVSASTYQTYASDYEHKAWGMGIPGGKVLHSDHNNNTTIGCIGVEMAKWQDVFNSTQSGDPIFVWSENFSGGERMCTGSPGTSGIPPKSYPTKGKYGL
jgi:hypothetical protein